MKSRGITGICSLFACVLMLGNVGCRTAEPYTLNVFEREGLAFSRILCSPLSIVGFTYAECQEQGPEGVFLFPFTLCMTVPAGVFAMATDIVTGTGEMVIAHQFKEIHYPWESFDFEVAVPWCIFSKTLICEMLRPKGQKR